MKKERLKSVFLAFLIISSLVLGSKILTEKKLWPNGYNFFSNANVFEFSGLYSKLKNYFSEDTVNKAQGFIPGEIVLNTGDQTTRISVKPNSDEFFEILSLSEEILQSALTHTSEYISDITRDEFLSSLTSDSVYFDFSQGFESTLMAGMLGIKGNELSGDLPKKLSDVVIVHSPKTSVYLADISAGDFCRINLGKSYDELIKLISRCINSNENSVPEVINYSFELKFDRPFGEQKTTLNPMIRIYSEEVGSKPVIYSKNPISPDEATNNEITDSILRIFNINPNTMRWYTEAGGTIVYVENNATLKIDTDGCLEYVTNGQGTELSSGINEYNNISAISKMAGSINKALNNEAQMYLSGIDEKTNTYYFDYQICGLGVSIATPKLSSGAEIVVENGYLKSFKQLLRAYTVTNGYTHPSGFFTALDTSIANYSAFMNEIYINKMNLGYTDDGGEGEKFADWIVKVDNVIAND